LRIHRTIQASTLVVSLAVVGSTLFLATRTSVVLIVDGRVESIATSSQNVRELLESEGVELSSDTRVVPPLATTLSDGMTVVVSPAPGAAVAGRFTGSATIDVGSSVANPGPTGVGVWVVEGASSGPAAKVATELGEASASVVGAGRAPAVRVRAVVAGKVHDVYSNAATVGGLLSAMGIAPGADDRVQPSPSTPLQAGLRVVFDRVRVLTRDVVRSMPFATRTTWSDQLAPGQVRVVSSGVAGLASLTVRSVIVNGRVESRSVVARRVLRPSIAEVRVSGAATATVTPEAEGSHVATGQATWYDPPWSGLTAASPWIPVGTHVRVTDVATGRTVIVVINDRGPFAPGRIIDLSPEAFSILAPLGQGVLDVRLSW